MKNIFKLMTSAGVVVLLGGGSTGRWIFSETPHLAVGSSAQVSGQRQETLDENDQKRDRRYQIDKALDTVGIKPGMVVGEVGAGYGYVIFKLAARVGPAGKIFAEDIIAEFLETLKTRAAAKGIHNIETIVGTDDDPKLPQGRFDMIFMHATIKFVDNPVKFFSNLAPSLKPDGKVVVIEMEKDRAADLSGNPVPDMFRSRREYLDLFDKTPFTVDRLDDTTVPYSTIFVLSIK